MKTLSPNFCLDQPPEDERELVELFVDREEELEEARQVLAGTLQRPNRRAVAVVGASRTGKSHILRRLLVDSVPDDVFQIFAYAPQRVQPEAVLRHGLRTLELRLDEALIEAASTSEEDTDLLDTCLLEAVVGYLEDLAPVVHDRSEAMEWRESTVASRQLLGRLSAGALAGALPFNVTASAGTTSQESAGTLVRVSRPTPHDLAELILLGSAALVKAGACRRVLFVVDDFDLLCSAADQEDERKELHTALAVLFRSQEVVVATTARQDYAAQHPRDFYPLTHAGSMDAEDLVRVYLNHVREYLGHDDPLPRALVREVSTFVDGRPGVFLQRMQQHYRRQLRGVPAVDHASLLQDFIAEVEHEAPEALEVLREAARRGRWTLNDEETTKVQSSRLVHNVAYPSYSTSHVLEIAPDYRDLLSGDPSEPG